MIPVARQPEPEEFDKLVRTKGKKFLAKFDKSEPTTKQWSEHAYWRLISDKLYHAYGGVCAYTAHWIPRGDNPHTDHFIPKSVDKNLAYEWSNYRLASALVNTLKKDYQDVIDPFDLNNDSFFLDFPSLLLRANPSLEAEKKEKLQQTINRLHLNGDKLVEDRLHWVGSYCAGEVTFIYLKKNHPFIAHELMRQDLVEKIKEMIDYRLLEWE